MSRTIPSKTFPRARRAAQLERLLELDAELRVLDLYDTERTSLGYDYGNGQRHAELSRRRRVRDELRVSFRYEHGQPAALELESTRERQLRAYERIAAKRTKRYTSAHEGYTTRTARLALTAWRSVKRELESGDDAHEAAAPPELVCSETYTMHWPTAAGDVCRRCGAQLR